jgi:acyl-CoA dehydrogenase
MDVTNIISILVMLGLVLAVGILQLSIIVWTITIGVALLLLTVTGSLAIIPAIIFWIIYLAAAGFSNFPKWRQQRIVLPALKTLQKQMPTISSTEREAIEAGDTWWE